MSLTVFAVQFERAQKLHRTNCRVYELTLEHSTTVIEYRVYFCFCIGY